VSEIPKGKATRQKAGKRLSSREVSALQTATELIADTLAHPCYEMDGEESKTLEETLSVLEELLRQEGGS
jgi:hypothetical protein